MAAVADRILGREPELASIGAFLEHPGSPPRVLVLHGEPGIGKTTLWQAGIALASQRGYQVRSTRPTESEAKLSYAGLGDLLQDLGEDAFANLPGPQRVALEVALLRAEAPEAGLDHRTVCVAVLATLRTIAASARLLVAVDDLQWLDGPTAQVLGFVARRLEDEPVCFIATVREAGTHEQVKFVRNIGDDNVHSIKLKGLSAESLGMFLQARLDTSFPKPTINRLLEASGGNPFFALEIARAISDGHVRPEPGRPLNVPGDLAGLLARRISRLPSTTVDVLLVCSALSKPTRSLLRSAVSAPNRVDSSLKQAIAAGVIKIEDEHVSFAHPLLASTVYEQSSLVRRHVVHQRLAEVVSDPEERAKHLALATTGVNPVVAAEAESAADHAFRRGAPAAAAELSDLAIRLTPPDDLEDWLRRTMAAAEHHYTAGDPATALELSRRAAAKAPPGSSRAHALFRLGRLELGLAHYQVAGSTLEEALSESGLDPSLESSLHEYMFWVMLNIGNFAAARRHAQAALSLAEQLEDRSLLAMALTSFIHSQFVLGEPVASPVRDRAMALLNEAEPRSAWEGRMVFLEHLIWSGQFESARAWSWELYGQAIERGSEPDARQALYYLADIAQRAGQWGEAAELSAQAYELELQMGIDPQYSLAEVAMADACAGRVESARARAEEALARSRPLEQHKAILESVEALGFLELSLGNAKRAHHWLQKGVDLIFGDGIGEPGIFQIVPDDIEALVTLGELNQAEPLLAWLEERGQTLDRPYALAIGARSRAIFLAAQGDIPAALASLDAALKHHERLPMPFELGRTLLVQGAIRRRGKQKRSAREALQRALEIFQGLGAPLWADKARAELARVSGRRSVEGELTSAERRVVRLAAVGRTNKEIADALFMSPRTVGGHLSHAYAKLGIRSRTELALFTDLVEDAPLHL